jgi:hypothetical protein
VYVGGRFVDMIKLSNIQGMHRNFNALILTLVPIYLRFSKIDYTLPKSNEY